MSRLSCAAILILCFLLLLISPVNCLARSKVLFDQGHGQRFLVERGADLDLSILFRHLRDLGNAVYLGTYILYLGTLYLGT